MKVITFIRNQTVLSIERRIRVYSNSYYSLLLREYITSTTKYIDGCTRRLQVRAIMKW